MRTTPPSNQSLPRASASSGLAMRCLNLQSALNALHLAGPLTSPELGRQMEVYPSTINRLMGALTTAGLVEEVDAGPHNSVGRPPKTWGLRADAGYVVGLHVSPEAVRAVLIDLAGQVVARHLALQTPRLGTEALPDAVVTTVEGITAGVPAEGVMGVGIGMAGVVDPAEGVVTRAGGLLDRDGNSAMGYPLRSLLADRIPYPIQIANDANVGALAIFRRMVHRGAVPAAASLLYMLLATGAGGVGCGLVISGRLHSGVHGAAGEVMHTGRALTFPPVADLAHRAQAGDREATEAVLRHRRPMLELLGALAQTFDPDCVVLGGEFAALQPLAAAIMQDIVDDTPGYWGYLDETPSRGIVTDPLWPDTIALGAADLIFEELFCTPVPGETGPLVNLALQRELEATHAGSVTAG